MDDYSVKNSGCHSAKLSAEYESVLTEYLPFIEHMREKSTGTEAENKWKLMYSALVQPKKKLSLGMLQNVRGMLEAMRTNELKNESLQAMEKEENPSPSNGSEIEDTSQPLAVTEKSSEAMSHQDSHSEHSYSKLTQNKEEEASSNLVAPPSTSNAILISTAESSNETDEKSSHVRKLNIYELFQSHEPSDDFNFDVSDSEYPELEKDDAPDSVEDTASDELSSVQKEPDTESEELEKKSDEPEKQVEEILPEPVDMELDEELMTMNRRNINEERESDGSKVGSQEISSYPSDAISLSPVESVSESEKSVPAGTSPVRKEHFAIMNELIKVVVQLKEQMIMEKGEKREQVSDCEDSDDGDLDDSFLEEAKKKRSMKIKLPSAKKRRIEQKAKNIKKEEDSEGFKGFARSEVEDFNDITIIPYQCSTPVMSVENFPLFTYNNVSNISFAKLKRGFMFKCLVNGCRFQTLVRDTLKEHLDAKHSDQEWLGFCNICAETVVPTKVTVREEFTHLEAHMEVLQSAANNAQSDSFKVSKHSSVFLSPSSLPDNSCVLPTKTASAEQRPKKSSSPSVAQKPAKTITEAKNPSPAIQTPKATSFMTKLPTVPEFQPSIGDQTVKSSNSLRPWLQVKLNKNQEQAQAMLQSKEALAANYKCMSSTCSFHTIDRELFLNHLSFHEKFTASDKLNFLTCSYCNFVATQTVNLADHVDNEHVHDQFQCSYCFYRACTVFTVTTHQSLFHKTLPSVIIECELIKPRDTRAHLEKVAKLRAEFVPPMVCVFCRGIFFVMQAFKEHLLKHNTEKLAKCIKCGKNTTSHQLHGHLEACHGIGTYHCVYCSFGTENFDKLNNHIVNNHSSKIPLFCERVWNKNPDGALKHKSPSVVEATCIKNIKPSLKNHCKKELRKASKDQFLLRNEDNVGMLKPNLVIHKTSERKSSETSTPKSAVQKPMPVKPSGKQVTPASQTVRISSQTVKATSQTLKAAKPVKIQAVSRLKIVAQMPKEIRTPSQEICSLLKPL